MSVELNLCKLTINVYIQKIYKLNVILMFTASIINVTLLT